MAAGRVLRERDVVELAELLTLVRDDVGPSLSWAFMHRLKDLVGCDNLAFFGLDSGAPGDYFSQNLDDQESYDGRSIPASAEDDPFWRHYWNSPCSRPETSREHAVVIKVSDFYSTREWHSTGMYVDFMAVEGYEHELMFWLPDGLGRSVRLLCARGPGHDFGERERLLLALLRPHVAESYRKTLRRRAAPAALTSRQVELLSLVREGQTNRQIARHMDIAEGTVRTHLNNIFERLGVTSRTAAVTKGLSSGV